MDSSIQQQGKQPPSAQKNLNRLTGWIIVLGFLVLVLAAALLIVLPNKANLSEGFVTPIVAFELARTPSDLSFLTGDAELTKHLRKQMHLGLLIDMGFAFAYGCFIVLLFVKALFCEQSKKIVTTKLGLFMAGCIPFFDVIENLSMLALLDALDTNQTLSAKLLVILQYTTWLKWLCIGVAFLLLALHFFYQYKSVSTLYSNNTFVAVLTPATVASACFGLTMLAFITMSALMAELMALSVAVAIGYFWLRNLRQWSRKPKLA